MRISDWSADVCSSDLPVEAPSREAFAAAVLRGPGQQQAAVSGDRDAVRQHADLDLVEPRPHHHALHRRQDRQFRIDRKSVLEGKSVSVRVDLGGRRIIKKKSKQTRMKKTTALKT